jgi:hypothetical protein
LLEAVFFTVRVSVAWNGRDNLYKFFSTQRRATLRAILRADLRAFVDPSLAQTIDEAALTRFAMRR